MTDLLSAFLLKAANDCIGDEVFVLEEELPQCSGCGADLTDLTEHDQFDDEDFCLLDTCQPCCSEGRRCEYTRARPCPSCVEEDRLFHNDFEAWSRL